MAGTGDNLDRTLKSYASRIAGLMDQIKDIREEVKGEVAAAKQAGLDTRALLRVVKEMGLPPEAREKQLEFELVVDDYRKAVGLLTEVGAEQQAA